MEKLLKPADYAKMRGISRQAVYMKIKKGAIPSKRIDGKLYVVVEDSINKEEIDERVLEETIDDIDNSDLTADRLSSRDSYEGYLELIRAKDETISILKETIADLKESNRMITTTLKSEVELLKESFYEMKKLYTLQIEHITGKDMGDDTDSDTIDIEDIETINEPIWISLDEWLTTQKVSDKKSKKIYKRVKKLYKKGSVDIKLEDGQYYIRESISISDILG